MVKYGKLTAAEWVKRAVPTTALGTHGTILYGVAAMQGWRDAQEDAHEMGVCADGSAFFFGVYDGHGGPAVAAFAAQQLRGEFEKRVQHGASTAAALEAAYVACDARLSAGEVDGADAAGSTALTVVVTASEIVCACAGDSVGVFCRGGRRRATPLGAAHTPREAGEAARIGAAGGLVLRGRVNGSLAVSRALGDVSFKRNSAKPPAEQAVVAVPDVQTFAREAADEFFVVACDGVWDVFTLEQVATFVETAWRAQVREPSQIAKRLIEFALLRGSKDNLTALVVILNADRLTQRLGQRRDTLTRVSRSADSRGEAASRGGSARNTPSAKHSHKLAICVDNS
ncbi:phosphatase 2C-like domain-containing protein [Pelagophyceae sp. CCMP2097]|nr:phosphatase 2C-like domain-containing protein [Pelagophyceae sp. CCMP2097]